MDNLKKISLEHNKVERIPRNLFKNNLKLEQFWFFDNKIKFIDANMFNQLSKLQNIDLRANLCTEVDYYAKDFKAMRTDLEQHCTGSSNQTNLEIDFSEMQRKLETVTRENLEMSIKLKLLENDCEALKKRVDAFNETLSSVAVVFDG